MEREKIAQNPHQGSAHFSAFSAHLPHQGLAHFRAFFAKDPHQGPAHFPHFFVILPHQGPAHFRAFLECHALFFIHIFLWKKYQFTPPGSGAFSAIMRAKHLGIAH
ncbi:MAG TPA: hypothetical protein VL485_06865 [Ktedonobacteraceae bacterium]|jgi:hypothetical protein|nr:hypothetical protein [Ktedonobacteraceae bacterium]